MSFNHKGENMKTIRVGNSGNRTLWTLLLISGLGALYFYQRRGGKITDLIASGAQQFTAARQKIGQIAPSVESTQATV